LTVRTARPSGSIATAYRPLAAAFLAVSLLTACAGISRQELNSLGSEITPAAINFNELTDYGRRAKAVYGPETQISAAYPKTVRIAEQGTAKVRYFLERDESAKVQHLTIRGTANKRNLKEDMESRVRVDPSSGLPVHKGFEADARAVYADVKPHLQKGYGTRIAGHSLGGAVASLVAIYAIADGYRVEKIVTFGQPRFTTQQGVAKLDFLPLMRVVDENDIIPMLPPGGGNKAQGPYDQVGAEVILLEGPRYVYLPGHAATRLAVGELWRNMGVADLHDHKMDNYLKRLAEKSQGAVQVPYDQREKYVARRPARHAAAIPDMATEDTPAQ
jgi:hypothetical protein